MRLHRVAIDQVRNLNEVRLSLSPSVNILSGENASGKTSFLESIFLLAYARSFRSHQLKYVVTRGTDTLRVTAQLSDTSNQIIPVGVEYAAGKLRMRAQGRNLQKTSELAQFLPVIVLHQESQRLLTDGPKLRRKFLDWGVFHVEQDFIAVWRRYIRVLKQRNTVLQSGQHKNAVTPWNLELKECADLIHQYRQQYCDVFIPLFQAEINKLIRDRDDISIRYRPGWDITKDFLTLLDESYDADSRRGFTHVGAHRADLQLKTGNVSAHENLSRGQQKLLVVGMLIAQAQLHSQYSNKSSVILIDDLQAELDIDHVGRVVRLLEGLNTQLILTATASEHLTTYCNTAPKRFHVERGLINEVL